MPTSVDANTVRSATKSLDVPTITIELLDADAAIPLLYHWAKVEQLDAAGKPSAVLFDGRTDSRGKLALRFPASAAGQPSVALPKVQLRVLDLDGTAIHTASLQLDARKPTISVKVKTAPLQDKLRAPLETWSASLSHPLSPKLRQALQALKIDSLATLRANAAQLSGVSDLSPADRADIELLSAHARLQLISRDHKINQALIDKGYRDIFAILEKSPKAFAKSLAPLVPDETARALHRAATEALALANDRAVERKVALANGRAKAAADGTDAPPCDCSCQSALSPLAYLADLLDHAVRHAKSNGDDIDLAFLVARFFQAFDRLPVDCSVSETQVRQARICVEVLRGKAKAEGVDAGQGFKDLVQAHVDRAYESLLRELGTSYTELRLSRTMRPEARQALADRLDVDVALLDALTLSVGASSAQRKRSEDNLERVFGLLSTARDPFAAVAASALADNRMARLNARWKSEDDRRAEPILDPDVVERDWIAPTADGDVAADLREQFSQDLDTVFATLSARTNDAAALEARLTNGDLAAGGRTVFHALKLDLQTLIAQRGAGQDYGDGLRGGTIKAQELDALLAVRELARGNQADADDWQVAWNILTAIEKRARLYRDWREREKAKGLTLSPQFFLFPDDVFAISRPSEPRSAAFVQWRFDADARRAWRDTLAMRRDQRIDLDSTLGALVGRVEEVVLPQLRDDIIALVVPGSRPLDAKRDRITNDLLINAAQGGCCQTSRIAQAVETVQLLLWGIRAGQFEDQTLTLDAPSFDDEWHWLGSYATWRAAMSVFLYPENFLRPELANRTTQVFRIFCLILQRWPDLGKSDGTGSTIADADDEIVAYANELAWQLREFDGLEDRDFFTDRWLARVVWRLHDFRYTLGDFMTGTLSDQAKLEDWLYIPVAIAVRFHDRGDFQAALDWFGKAFDSLRVGFAFQALADLIATMESSATDRRGDDWLLDPLDVSAIAENRRGALERLVVILLARCLLNFADSEFARGTAEGRARARELFLTAQRVLGSQRLGEPESCDSSLQRLVIDIGEPHYRTIVLTLLQGLLEQGRYQDLPERVRADLIATVKAAARSASRPRPDAEVRGQIREAVDKSFPAQRAVSFKQRLDDARKTTRAVLRPLLDEQASFQSIQNAVGRRSISRAPAGLVPSRDRGIVVRGDVITIVSEPPSFTFCVPPNPVFAGLRLRVQVGLFKLNNCLNSAGLARPVESYSASNDGGQIVAPAPIAPITIQPTQYRYRTLIDRARQLTGIAQQMESAYLNFLERFDAETYNEMLAEQQLGVANATVRLQDVRLIEASDGRDLAGQQWTRAQASFQYFDGLVQGGISALEQESLDQLENARTLQGIAAQIQGVYGSVLASASSGVAGWDQLAGAMSSTAAAAATASQIASTRASFERRAQEWGFQRSLADIDMSIAQQQQVLAQDHYEITSQERSIANIAADNAGTAVTFLRNKFTNPELYQWMSGVVGSAYRYFLQEATALAKLAQTQLAFERQEQPLGLIADDYWAYPASNGSAAADGAPDRRGLTGSARLLEDISKLDEHVFKSDQRKLQLSKTISLAQFDPYAFARFCRTGVLPFATSLEQFDRDFPGQYLRLIKRVRVSVMALIPPTEGIKATLSTTGISRVVISPQAGSQYSEVEIRRLPESVALTSPLSASGVFDLVEQPEMLLPFEGSGAASQWTFDLPRAANAIDFANIADVLITIDYTALHSPAYRQQVVQQLGSDVQADRAYSLRYDFPDVWYDLHNPDQVPDAEQMKATLEVEASDFPPNLVRLNGAAKVPDIKIQQVQLYVAREDGEIFELPVGLTLTATNGAPVDAGTATTRDGVVSTRQASGSGWQQRVAAKLPIGTWLFDLTGSLQAPDGQVQAQKIRDAFKNDLIKDILFVISYEGQTPSFPTAV